MHTGPRARQEVQTIHLIAFPETVGGLGWADVIDGGGGVHHGQAQLMVHQYRSFAEQTPGQCGMPGQRRVCVDWEKLAREGGGNPGNRKRLKS